jgi:Zn-dependent membrane protease YugP
LQSFNVFVFLSKGVGPVFYANFHYLLYVAPAILLALWAQYRVRSAYAEAQRLPAPLSGAAAARHILDSAGLQQVAIETVPGHMTDHYDPKEKVLRLSSEVYQSPSLAAVGIAAHEAGHAIQDAHAYAPLAIRNAAVPVASFGAGPGMLIILLGFIFAAKPLIIVGIALFAGMVFFQLVNLPVEFDASARAKRQLVGLGICDDTEMRYVSNVLNAAAWTYVAATLESVLTLVYYLSMVSGGNDRD